MTMAKAPVLFAEHLTADEIDSLLSIPFFDAWLNANAVKPADSRLDGICRVDGTLTKWAAFAWSPRGVWRGAGQTPASAINDLVEQMATTGPIEP